MNVKKIGKAKANPVTGLWEVEAKPVRFLMNQRLVEMRPEMKSLRSLYSRHASKKPPSKRRPQERDEHFQEQKRLQSEIKKLLHEIYEEILQGSFEDPVLLRADRDFDHKSDWRYCLYQGIIYQFDRPDYGDEEMIRQINELNARHES
jgi:hypothetical protein